MDASKDREFYQDSRISYKKVVKFQKKKRRSFLNGNSLTEIDSQYSLNSMQILFISQDDDFMKVRYFCIED